MITAIKPERFANLITRKVVDTYDLSNGRRIKIHTAHSKERKVIATVVSECSVSHSGSFIMEKWRQGEDTLVRVSVIPCSRYSEKALYAAHTAGVELAADLVRELLNKNATLEKGEEE